MTNINEILRVSQMNHTFLIKSLNSNKGRGLAGKWVAVAKKRIFSDKNSRIVLKKAKEVEPLREKILLIKVPDKNILSLRF